MTLVRWSPFRELGTLQDEMNRLFEDFTPTRSRDLTFAPAAELEETAENYLLKLEVPGIDTENLDIQASADAVAITGERKLETKTEADGLTRSEFRYGRFQRVIPMPGRIDHQEIAADYKDGILNLTLPKAEAEKNKVVKVSLAAVS